MNYSRSYLVIGISADKVIRLDLRKILILWWIHCKIIFNGLLFLVSYTPLGRICGFSNICKYMIYID